MVEGTIKIGLQSFNRREFDIKKGDFQFGIDVEEGNYIVALRNFRLADNDLVCIRTSTLPTLPPVCFSTSSGAAKGCYKTKEVCLRDKRCQKKAYEKVQQKKNLETFDKTASNV